MENTVYTYGAGELLAQVFNGIAALINSENGVLFNPLVSFAAAVGLVWSIANMVYGDQVTGFIKNWVVPFYLSLALFFIPSTRVHIHDQVTGFRYTVDNVPWGLGASAGLLSGIGHKVTKGVEMVFSLPDDLKYHQSGSMMASNLIANSKKFQITSTELKQTMRSFVNQCVVYDAMLGRKFTFDDLKNSKDIWRLIADNASPARSFVFKAPGRASVPEIITCQAGVARLEPLLAEDVENAFQLFDKKIFGNPDNVPGAHPRVPGRKLKQYLPGAMNYMTGMANAANDFMMQQMMIYAVVDGIESKSTELGNAQNFAVRKAYLQQRANQETTAGVAAQKVVALKNVMEVLVYFAFLFMLPLALLPKGWTAISKWFGLMMWVQLWPPFYAVLNFIQTFSAKKVSEGMVTDAGGAGMTISNSVGMIDLHADMAAQAGFMSLTVGTLAYALVKGGAASFVHLAGQMSGPAAAAAGAASDSMMSGNYNYGNISSGTVSANNNNSGQFNDSPTYASGAFTQNDGITSRTSNGDDHISTTASSKGRSDINIAESTESSLTAQSSQEARLAETQGVQAAQAEADQFRQTMDFANHRAMNQSGGTGTTASDSVGENQSLSRLNNLTEKFAQDNGISKDASSQLLAKATASVSGGFGFEVFGSGVSARGTVEGATQVQDTDAERKSWSAAKDFVEQNNFQDALNKGSQAVRDMKHSDMSDEGKRLAQGINASYDKSNTYREESGKSLQRSKAYSEMASDVHRNSTSINSNANQEYAQWLRQQSLPNSKGPMGVHEAEVIMSSRPDMERQYQQRFVEQKVSAMTSHLQSSSGPKSFGEVKESYEKAAVNNNVSKEPLRHVEKQGAEAGLGNDFKVNRAAQSKADQAFDTVQSKMNRDESSLKTSGGDLKQSVQAKTSGPVQTSPAISGGNNDLLNLEGGGASGLSHKIQNIENQMADQTEAMEKASKMQKFANNKNLGV